MKVSEEAEIVSSEESSENHSEEKRTSLLEKISYGLVTLLTFLLPVFVYFPFSGFPVDFGKKALLFTFTILALMFWLLARFEDGKFIFPGGKILKSSLFLFASFLISAVALFKGESSVANSVFGVGYDSDTVIYIFVLLVLMFLSSIYYQSMKRLSHFYIALMSSFLAVFAVEITQLFMDGNLLVNDGIVTNLVGKWNDLGIFFGLGIVLSLSAIELLQLSLYPKFILSAILIGSLIITGIVNFVSVWVVVAVASLLIIVYSIFFNGSKNGGYNFGVKIAKSPAFLVLVLCVIMIFSQTQIGDMLSKKNIINVDVRPSFSATLDMAQSTMKESVKNLLIGSGPNSFIMQWIKYKPAEVNNTIFWNIDFTSGVGRIPSYAVTLGAFGLLAWALFLGILIYYGLRTILYSEAPRSIRFVTFVSFMGMLYLWVFSFIYIPDTVIFSLSFILTGVFVASLTRAGMAKNFEFSFFNEPRLGFASVLILVLLVITCISGGYFMNKKSSANFSYLKGVYALTFQGNLDEAESNLKAAIESDDQDLYERTLSDIYIRKLNKFVSEQEIADKESVAKLQEYIVAASASARKSMDLNQKNYQNWMAMGKVGETVVPLKVIEGAYTLANDSYKKALELSPANPLILLNLARLEIANGDVKKAKEYLNQAIDFKSNYTTALYLLSQIEASEGNLKGAIAKAEEAKLFAPDDVGILFQLGFLKFQTKDYEGSVIELERAVSLQSQYSNAKYFLGLSYSKIGKRSAALTQFKEIAELNPDNKEVRNIVRNLSEGRDPFESASE